MFDRMSCAVFGQAVMPCGALVMDVRVSLLQDGIGLVAINDSLWLESVIYEILKKFIRQEPYYLQVLELFQEVSCCCNSNLLP